MSFLLQWFLSQTISNFDDVKFEAASLLANLYGEQNQYNLAKPILRKAVELSNANVYWHCRLIFQLSVSRFDFPLFGPRLLNIIKTGLNCVVFLQQVHAMEKDYQ